MNTPLLTAFLAKHNNQGYVNEAEEIKEKDGSTTLDSTDGDWRLRDNFFGGEPYGGHVVVFHKNKPVWIMVYYGFVHESFNNLEQVYSFLKSALKEIPKEAPFRGPKQYQEKNLTYKNSWQGDVRSFQGTEKIFDESDEIYQAWYSGGLVDKRG